ncbi:MAG: DivIVA domain-containing protein [Microbacterium sp.]
MSDANNNGGREQGDFFEALVDDSGSAEQTFTVGFRGYDRGEVDAALADLKDQIATLNARLSAAGDESRSAADRAQSEQQEALEAVRAELAAEKARADEAERQVATLTTEFASGTKGDGDDPASRQQFEAILRVAEEQATTIIQNAAEQGERLLQSAHDEVDTLRAQLTAEAEQTRAQAERDADQVRLKMDTEYTAHQARLEREAAHATEKVTQAEQEAQAVRSEEEKGAAALRSIVSRETADLRAAAEREVREMNARVHEFEESLTRRQDEAQQEFLVLHNQAVAHAERITKDANDQVSSSLAHAQRISAKADDYERLARSQAQAQEADAQVKARDILDRAQVKAQKIVDVVTTHTNTVLRDAEDRTRQLRWQQQQLTSFMAEVRELMRPDGPLGLVGQDVDTERAEEEPTDAEAETEAPGVEEVEVTDAEDQR